MEKAEWQRRQQEEDDTKTICYEAQDLYGCCGSGCCCCCCYTTRKETSSTWNTVRSALSLVLGVNSKQKTEGRRKFNIALLYAHQFFSVSRSCNGRSLWASASFLPGMRFLLESLKYLRSADHFIAVLSLAMVRITLSEDEVSEDIQIEYQAMASFFFRHWRYRFWNVKFRGTSQPRLPPAAVEDRKLIRQSTSSEITNWCLLILFWFIPTLSTKPELLSEVLRDWNIKVTSSALILHISVNPILPPSRDHGETLGSESRPLESLEPWCWKVGLHQNMKVEPEACSFLLPPRWTYWSVLWESDCQGSVGHDLISISAITRQERKP